MNNSRHETFLLPTSEGRHAFSTCLVRPCMLSTVLTFVCEEVLDTPIPEHPGATRVYCPRVLKLLRIAELGHC